MIVNINAPGEIRAAIWKSFISSPSLNCTPLITLAKWLNPRMRRHFSRRTNRVGTSCTVLHCGSGIISTVWCDGEWWQTLIQSDRWFSATSSVPLENHRTLAVPLDPWPSSTPLWDICPHRCGWSGLTRTAPGFGLLPSKSGVGHSSRSATQISVASWARWTLLYPESLLGGL